MGLIMPLIQFTVRDVLKEINFQNLQESCKQAVVCCCLEIPIAIEKVAKTQTITCFLISFKVITPINLLEAVF